MRSLSDYEIAVSNSIFELAQVESFKGKDVIELRFNEPLSIETLMIYSGYIKNSTMVFDIEFSNGNKISSLTSVHNDKTMAIASFEPIEVEWIKIYNKGNRIELSEIIVMPKE